MLKWQDLKKQEIQYNNPRSPEREQRNVPNDGAASQAIQERQSDDGGARGGGCLPLQSRSHQVDQIREAEMSSCGGKVYRLQDEACCYEKGQM